MLQALLRQLRSGGAAGAGSSKHKTQNGGGGQTSHNTQNGGGGQNNRSGESESRSPNTRDERERGGNDSKKVKQPRDTRDRDGLMRGHLDLDTYEQHSEKRLREQDATIQEQANII